MLKPITTSLLLVCLIVSNLAAAGEKPQFPTPEEAAKIKRSRPAVSYPSVSVNFGGALRNFDPGPLNESFVRQENYYGVARTKTFNTQAAAFALGMRLHVSSRLSFWWQFHRCRMPSLDAEDGSATAPNLVGMQEVSLSLLYTVYFGKRGAGAFSFGIGVASQKLSAVRQYNASTSDGGTLEAIEARTSSESALPLTLLLELPGPRITRAGLYLATTYMAGNDAEVANPIFSSPGSDEMTLKASMRGYWMSAGITYRL